MLESIDLDQLARVAGGAMQMQTEAGPGQAIPPYPVENQNGILRPRTNENTMSGRGNMPIIGPDFDPGRNTRQIGV
jgi:hypothetical protein